MKKAPSVWREWRRTGGLLPGWELHELRGRRCSLLAAVLPVVGGWAIQWGPGKPLELRRWVTDEQARREVCRVLRLPAPESRSRHHARRNP